MINITCKNGDSYGFDFVTPVNAMRITKTGKVKFSPHPDVQATLEFPSPAVSVKNGDV